MNYLKAILKTAVQGATVLLLAAGLAKAQTGAGTVSLTAAPAVATMPDGSAVPMWGYFCGTTAPVSATCATMNPSLAVTPVAGAWSPVLITVPVNPTTGAASLTISLTNNLYFTPAPTTIGGPAGTPNAIPTSIMIVGQVGGGLGAVSSSCPLGSGAAGTAVATGSTCVASPSHAGLPTDTVTWSTVGTSASFVPPNQGPRVRSFGTEVPALAATSTTGTNVASLTWASLKPGTYLLESGSHPSIQVPMGLYGVLVVTNPATAGTTVPATETAPGCAYGFTPAVAATTTTAAVPASCAIPYDAEVAMALGEIDPVQNGLVSAAVNHNGFSETRVWSGLAAQSTTTGGNINVAAGCGNPTSTTYLTCYPPAVNYTPLYYTVNGVAFNKTQTTSVTSGGVTTTLSPSVMNVTPGTIAPAATTTGAATTGNVLVRVVNAGLRMHVPSIVGSQVAGATGATNPIVTGFKVMAEDGNPLPGLPKIRSEVFMAAGKVFDLEINGLATSSTGTIAPYPNALAIYDRELSLSGNATGRDEGMLAYIGIDGKGLPADPNFTAAVARADTYNGLSGTCTAAPCPALTISDPGKGVIANDTNVYGVTLLGAPTKGSVILNRNGTFVYTPTGTGVTSDSFTYCANGTVTGTTCSSGLTASVTIGESSLATSDSITCVGSTFNAPGATYLAIKTPGVLAGCTDAAGLPLTVDTATVAAGSGLTLYPDANGGFTASVGAPGTYTFSFQAINSQKLHNTAATTVTLIFPNPSMLSVTVLDGQDKTTQIADYRWIIEEDRTFYVNPACSANPPPSTCPTASISGFGGVSGIVPTLGTNFHTSYMPYVAQGCTGPLSCEGGQTAYNPATGTHIPVVCDVGNGSCRPDLTGNGQTATYPGAVALDPTKRYYISVLPGDAASPFTTGYAGPGCAYGSASAAPGATCGHGMGGAPIAAACTPVPPATTCTGTFAPVTVITQPTPLPLGKLSAMVFEDDFPLNGEQDGGGGVDVLSPVEPGLGQFQIHLWDAMGGNGDFTGQMTYDMFNQPLTNALAGTIDPNNGLDACPIGSSTNETSATTAASPKTLSTDPTATGITGMIVTCPKYESDHVTLSPLAGQVLVVNLMPGRWGAVATPGADRIARGEEWLQTNTLDGQKAHDVFTRVGEPSYFQEYGPASYHVTIGFANPAIINARHQYVCNGTDPNLPGVSNCTNTLTGRVTGEHLSRTPDERLYSSGSHDAYYWTQCYVSFGDPDGEDFIFTKCGADGTFTLKGVPPGDWRVTVFDQWNDLLVDGLSTPVGVSSTATNQTIPLGDIATTQWETNLYTRTFIDDNKDGISQASEAGIPFANVAVRLRDGSLENLLVTDFTGTANFNETFPLFSWYVVETDVTRYKNTGTHVVYDVGGPTDGSSNCGVSGYPPCGTSTIAKFLASTAETVSVPTNLRVPGSVYCAGADCSGKSIQNGSGTSDPPSVCTTSTATPPITTCSTILSSGRIDNPWMGGVEGWQGFPGQNNFLEFGKEPYVAGENGGIKGHVVYASTRPFDDPMMLVQTQWTPLVPNVQINLYQEGIATDGITPTLKLVDHTTTSSFDAWAQGFRADGVTPNMNCPGQASNTGVTPDLFFFSLYNQPSYLNFYNSQHGGPAITPLPNNAQYKCYDGMHNWNQIQPAPYDGMYQFPSITAYDANGKPSATNCTICTAKGSTTTAPLLPTNDLYYGLPQLPTGKYVVEVVLPQGYELVKEEDKNILIGDNFIAPATQQFGSMGNIFIIPDQASVASSQQYPGPSMNPYNAQNPTTSLGAAPEEGIVPGFIPEPIWPCVGEKRVVPDYISLFPQSKQVSPFAGATRPTCDRKEVTLVDQSHAIAKFFIYTSTHIASKFTGGITDDYTSEFDPFSPQFGEKFAPPDLPVSIKDWAGNEISRVYADHWGSYDGMTYSTWEVNPPNPTGYSPTMMVFCMNDPGPVVDTRATVVNSSGATVANPTLGQLVTDPAFTPGYSAFCYELPFMPGTTQYLDTPVVPTSAFAGAGYNNVDCAYPTMTPAIKEVDGDGMGPWVSAAGHTLTVLAQGDTMVPNNAYLGPAATTAPYNQKMVLRHYGFGTTAGTVTIGGVTAAATWSDLSLKVTVPAGVPACAVQQQAQYTGSAAQCGELVITASTGQQSVDTVNVTIGGKTPTHVAASGSIQSAIDAAAPGDLIIIDPTCSTTGATPTVTACSAAAVDAASPTQTAAPAAHQELVLMWKPVRLQGVGSASSVIIANTHPAGKLDPWRQRVACLFGLSLQGIPLSSTIKYDPSGQIGCPGTGWSYFVETSDSTGLIQNAQVDPLSLEAIVGWDASQNGNLAQLLQEPTLMGALEGAGITVLAKGVNFPVAPNTPSAAAAGTAGTFPTGTTLLTGPVTATGAYPTGDANPLCHTSSSNATNPFPSNFSCNPSSIDGLAITQSSQGGGGIYVHGWAHNLQIANNHIYSNAGTLSGGINLGQGEFAPSSIQGSTTNSAPGSCEDGLTSIPVGAVEPWCENLNVSIHNNNISLNSSTGDELFSGTPAGAGGVSICTGADYYNFNYNWVCGNLSSGDGGGVGQLGLSYNGNISNNTILFNQSLNPTIPANGGGLLLMGTPDVDTTCGATIDIDCLDPAALRTPSDGIGPNITVNANLIMGNGAEAGSGGGIRLQAVNGGDVEAFPKTPANWWSINITNNIVADNVAGWDGAGISLYDALNTNIVNNTVVNNSTTASAGILFTTIGAPIASADPGAPGPGTTNPTSTYNCTQSSTTSCPQPSGLVTVENSSALQATLPPAGTATSPGIVCPAGHYQGASANDGTCRMYSYPVLANNIFYNNSAYYIGVGALSNQYQQNIVSLYVAGTTTLAPNQTTTGACPAGVTYWDLGTRGDTSPITQSSGITLNPTHSVITASDITPYAAGFNTSTAPSFTSSYCDGSRIPPEAASTSGGSGYAVPPGIADATVPNPIFNLSPVATVDEGNNWINLRWGPLTLSNPVSATSTSAPQMGNYNLAAALNNVSASVPHPALDFFGHARPSTGNPNFDSGAVVFSGTGTVAAPTIFSIVPNSEVQGTSVGVTITGTNLTGGTVAATPAVAGFTITNVTDVSATTITATFTSTSATPLGAVNIAVTTAGGTSNTAPFTIIAGTPVLSVTPTSLTFTATVSTTSAAQTLTLSNTGTASATGIGLTFTGPFSRPAGAAGGTCTAALAPGTCTINVVFNAPATAGPSTGSLAIAANVAVTGSPVTLSGTATATSTGGVTVTPNPLAFGNVPVGNSPTMTFTIVNATTGTVARPTVAAPFTRAGGSCTATMAVGTCTYNVTFTPTATGPVSGPLTFAAGVVVNAGAGASMTGTGITGTSAATVTGGPLAFGIVADGSTSAAHTFTINNTGTVNLARPTVPAPFARSGGSCGATINAGTTCTYNVVFSPTAVTTSTGSLTFAAGVTVTGNVSMSGTGAAAALTFSGPLPALTTATANTTTKTGVITVQNAGAVTYTFSGTPTVTRVGGGGGFSITGNTCTGTLLVGGSCSVTVQYAPGTSTNTRNAFITVTGNPLLEATQSTNSPNFPAN